MDTASRPGRLRIPPAWGNPAAGVKCIRVLRAGRPPCPKPSHAHIQRDVPLRGLIRKDPGRCQSPLHARIRKCTRPCRSLSRGRTHLALVAAHTHRCTSQVLVAAPLRKFTSRARVPGHIHRRTNRVLAERVPTRSRRHPHPSLMGSRRLQTITRRSTSSASQINSLIGAPSSTMKMGRP